MRTVPHQLLELNISVTDNRESIRQYVAAAKKFGYTGIVIHLQELFSILATPSPHAPRLQVENLIHEKNYTLQCLKIYSTELQKNDLTFWLQGESVPHDDILRRKFPEFDIDNVLIKDFWDMFYHSVIQSVLENIPWINGFIFSLTMPEAHQEKWIEALNQVWRTLRRHGKTLILRDFIDAGWPRQQLLSVITHLSTDVRASIKATELDFHPGFANHPHIAMLPGHKKWIEYDLWGTGYGWSLLPCYLMNDIQQRFNWAMSLDGEGVEAITTRICWKWLPGRTTLESVNIINMLGIAHINTQCEDLSGAVETDWLHLSGMSFKRQADRQQFFSSLRASYQWLTATPNVLGRRLHYQSQIPDSLFHARQLLHMDTRSANWAQSFQPFLPADDRQCGLEQRNLVALEKEKAAFLANTELQKLRLMQPDVTDPFGYFHRALEAWQIATLYGEMFRAVALATTDAIWLEQYGDDSLPASTLSHHQQVLRKLADKLDTFLAGELAPGNTALPLLLSPERLVCFADSFTKDEL